MKVFFLVVLLAACEGHSIIKHRNVTTRGRCLMDQSVHEELKILKEELIRTNAKLQAMATTQQCLHSKLFEIVLAMYKLLLYHSVIYFERFK